MIERVMVMEIIISVILLFVGIAVLIIIHICIVGRAFRRGFGGVDGVLQRGSVPIIRGATAGMTPQDLKKLPCFEFKGEEKVTGGGIIDCAVCLDNFKVGDKCRTLPVCHHCFHVVCIDVWLIKTPLCPICRTSAKPLPKICLDVAQGSNSSTPSNIIGDDLL